tara:strand:+ start:422 stop:1249 length:828 start_codon:yes stop_codon:yes gene_type:complete
MNWKLYNVSIPVKDLEESRDFYKMIAGDVNPDDRIHKELFDNTEDYFWGTSGFGFRIFKPKYDLQLKNEIQSRRSYLTILVDNILDIKNNLTQNDYDFIYKESNNFKKLLVQEPSLNLLQFVENQTVFSMDIDAYSMNLSWGLHHMNLESLDVRETVKFFCELIGLEEGRWVAPVNMGNFSIDPDQLSVFPVSDDNRGLHIIKPDDAFGHRNSFPHNPSIAGHPAFTVRKLSSVMDNLNAKNVLFSDAKVYAMPGFHQIYFYDINANMLEVNQSV